MVNSYTREGSKLTGKEVPTPTRAGADVPFVVGHGHTNGSGPAWQGPERKAVPGLALPEEAFNQSKGRLVPGHQPCPLWLYPLSLTKLESWLLFRRGDLVPKSQLDLN